MGSASGDETRLARRHAETLNLPPKEQAKTVAIVNPMAQNGSAGERWPPVARALARRFRSFASLETEGKGHATILARRALEAGAELVISVGGDGTTNEVLGGFTDAQGRNRFPEATLAVLAAGSGGDFQRQFGRCRLEQQVRRFLAAQARTIDYGVCHFTDSEGRPAVRPFLNVGSMGVSAATVATVNDSRFDQLGPTAKYLLGTVRGIQGWKNLQAHVRHDGGPAQRIDLTLLCVANGRYFGAGMKIAPLAEIDDGLFDVLEVAGMNKRHLLATLAKVFDGKHLRVRGVDTLRAKAIDVTPVHPRVEIPIELDGETVGHAPARFEIVAAGLRLRVGRA